MDQIVIIINNISERDLSLVRHVLESAARLREELVAANPAEEQRISSQIRDKIKQEMPDSALVLFDAYRVYSDAVKRLGTYNKDAQSKPLKKIALKELTQSEWYAIMVGDEQYNAAHEVLMAEFSNAVHDFIQFDQAIGQKYILEMNQENMTPMLSDSIQISTLEDLRKALVRLKVLGQYCDANPLMDKYVQWWVSYSEIYIYYSLHKNSQITPEEQEEFDNSLERASQFFEMNVEEVHAKEMLAYAKGACRAYLEFIKREREDQEKNILLEELQEAIEGALKVTMREHIEAVEALKQFHKIILGNADKVASYFNKGTVIFMDAMSKILNHCQLPIPSAFKAKPEERVEKTKSLSPFKIFSQLKEEKQKKLLPEKIGSSPSVKH